MTDFLSDAGERIAILRVVHRRVHNRFKKLLLYLGMKLKTAQDTKPHEFCKTLSEFALEYRTIRQRALETKKRKENQKKRTKTRGKLITEVSYLCVHVMQGIVSQGMFILALLPSVNNTLKKCLQDFSY